MPKTKNIKLRAFTIENNNPANKVSPLLKLLGEKLALSENVNERRIPVNKDDPEEDCISDYDDARKDFFLAWTMIRIAVADSTRQIKENDLQKKKVPFAILDAAGDNKSYICKSHYYYAINSSFMVTNMPTNRTIASCQTYINEYLKNERGKELFEFTPVISDTPETKVRDIKCIRFKNAKINPENDNAVPKKDDYEKRFIDIAKDKLFGLFDVVPNFDEILDEGLVSVELVVKFAKGKKDAEEYNRLLGATMKPIADVDNVEVEKKNGEKITGENILRTKNVDIELTENNNINEKQLFQEMERFLNELMQ